MPSSLERNYICEITYLQQKLWKKMVDAAIWKERINFIIHTVSSIDITLHGLYSKLKKQSVFNFLSGIKQNKIPLYATIHSMEKEKVLWEKQITDVLDKGNKKIKINVESWWSDESQTKLTLFELREFVGDEIELIIDITLELSTLKKLEPFMLVLEILNFKWLVSPSLSTSYEKNMTS